ncbi:cation:proton antiporter [Microvirga sp. 0TCS3.31]
MEEVGFAVLMLLVLAWAVVSHLLERLNVPTALVFLVWGYVLANPAWGVLAVDVEVPRMHLLVETTLALLLFSDAAQVNVSRLRQDLAFPARLLGIGLPLSIALGAVGAAVLLDDLTWALAGFVGAALAPTDAALSAPVINDGRVPQRVRRVINVESGLNDGIATPVVAFTLTVAAAGLGIGGDGSSPEARAVAELALGVLVGAVVGALGVGLITACSRRGWIAGGGGRVATMAAALASFSCAIALDGNGFIAAFVAGIAFAAGQPGTRAEHAGGPGNEDLVELPELVGRLLSLAVWFLFGAAMLPLALDHLSAATALYAVLSLTVFRMLPVALALVGSATDRSTVLFVGWFGPRGLASVVFALLAVEELGTASAVAVEACAVVTLTVLLSVVLHGVSAAPLGRWYARRQRLTRGG